MADASIKSSKKFRKQPLSLRLKRDMQLNWSLYLLVIPVILFYIIFHYVPLYGAQIAFRNFNPRVGVADSKWVGFDHFVRFIKGPSFNLTVKNTIIISLLDLVFGFPAPILLALLLNELHWVRYKKAVQTISYLPHFLSLIVVCGMIKDFSATNGLFNDLAVSFGGTRKNLLQDPNLFRPIYIISGIWQHIGWNAIIYIAAISGVDAELYEAAKIDGAGRWRLVRNVTLPSIAPTIIILFIMRLGSMFSVGYEKIILLYNPSTQKTADVISSYVYRIGLLDRNYSFSAAVGLFNSVINFILVFAANRISRKVADISLW